MCKKSSPNGKKNLNAVKNSNLGVTHHHNPLLTLSSMHPIQAIPVPVPFLKHTAHLLRQSMLPAIQ